MAMFFGFELMKVPSDFRRDVTHQCMHTHEGGRARVERETNQGTGLS